MLDAPTLPCADLPAPAVLRRVQAGAQTVVMFGEKVVFCYDRDDLGMRNMAVVALTDAGARGTDVAAVFGLSPEYVSMLRGRARAQGSAGLARRRGRPPKLGCSAGRHGPAVGRRGGESDRDRPAVVGVPSGDW